MRIDEVVSSVSRLNIAFAEIAVVSAPQIDTSAIHVDAH
jgi:hypothetical protein